MGKLHEKEKKKKEKLPKIANRITTLLYSTFERVPVFSTMPLTIEMVAPVWTTIAICLMVAFAVHAFEDVWT